MLGAQEEMAQCDSHMPQAAASVPFQRPGAEKAALGAASRVATDDDDDDAGPDCWNARDGEPANLAAPIAAIAHST